MGLGATICGCGALAALVLQGCSTMFGNNPPPEFQPWRNTFLPFLAVAIVVTVIGALVLARNRRS